MGKNKALAHHTSTYFHTRRVSIFGVSSLFGCNVSKGSFRTFKVHDAKENKERPRIPTQTIQNEATQTSTATILPVTTKITRVHLWVLLCYQIVPGNADIVFDSDCLFLVSLFKLCDHRNVCLYELSRMKNRDQQLVSYGY